MKNMTTEALCCRTAEQLKILEQAKLGEHFALDFTAAGSSVKH